MPSRYLENPQALRLSFQHLEPRQMLSLSTALADSISDAPSTIDQQSLYTTPAPVESEYTYSPAYTLEQPEILSNNPETSDVNLETIQVAISGDGFFIVTREGQDTLTRRGNFQIDEDNRLVTREGYQVLGHGATEGGEVVRDQLTPLSLPLNQEISQETSSIQFFGIVNPTVDIGHTTTSSALIYDESGNEIRISFIISLTTKTADSTVFAWKAYLGDHSDDEAIVGSGELSYDQSGNLFDSSTPSLLIQNETTNLEAALDFSEVHAKDSISAQGEAITRVTAKQINGFPPSTLQDVVIQNNGEIKGQFASGLELTLGQIVLGSVHNPHGLLKVEKNYFQTTQKSGELIVDVPESPLHGSLLHIFDREYFNEYLRENLTAANLLSPRYPWLIRSTNLSLTGKELFIVESRTGRQLYTRDGRFHINAQQELVTKNGLRVLGYGLNDNGEIDGSVLVPLKIPLGQISWQKTKTIYLDGNIYAPSITDFEVITDYGQPYTIRLHTILDSQDSESSNFSWIVTSLNTDGTSKTALGRGILHFDLAGNIIAGEIGEFSVQPVWNDTSQVIQIDFQKLTSIPSVDTSLDSSHSLHRESQDGFPQGTMTRYSVSESGEIVGEFTSGLTLSLGQLKLARFQNVFQLGTKRKYLQTANRRSGEPQYVTPDDPGVAAIRHDLSSNDIRQRRYTTPMKSEQTLKLDSLWPLLGDEVL